MNTCAFFHLSTLTLGGQSFFSRKDSIRTIYTSLYNELKKVVTMGRHAQPGSAPYLEDLLSHLSEQLCHFTQARMEMADLYEKMHLLGSQKTINSDELVTTLEAVLQKYSSRCVPLVFSTRSSWCVCDDAAAQRPQRNRLKMVRL